MKNGDFSDAIEDYTKAIELDPDYADAYNNRGYAYYLLEQYGKALNDYDKAIELDPNYEKTIYLRKMLLEEHPELKP